MTKGSQFEVVTNEIQNRETKFSVRWEEGIGVYDKIGNFAGAGSIVPITGFANSIVAPAMEHKVEGFVLGVGAQLFSLAGPVLVYGTIASIVVGVIAFFVR